MTDSARDEMEVLAKRARDLARPLEDGGPGGELLTLLELEIDGRRLGIGLEWVVETRKVEGWTPVPGTPDHVLGVLSLRGEVLSLVELGGLLGLGGGEGGYAVRLRRKDMEFCIRADAVLGARTESAEDLQDPGTLGSWSSSPLITGVTQDGLSLVDGELLLTMPVARAEPGMEGEDSP